MLAVQTHREEASCALQVITGFLGSGKTTLLNALLKQDHGRRIAVIENEVRTTCCFLNSLAPSNKAVLPDVSSRAAAC